MADYKFSISRNRLEFMLIYPSGQIRWINIVPGLKMGYNLIKDGHKVYLNGILLNK